MAKAAAQYVALLDVQDAQDTEFYSVDPDYEIREIIEIWNHCYDITKRWRNFS